MKTLSLVIFLLISLIVGGYQGAGAIDYRRYGENDEGIFFYDIESITHPSEETVGVWVREVFSGTGRRAVSRALGGGDDDLDQSVSQEELNCKDKTFRRLSLALYNKDGNVMSSSKTLAERFKPIEPNSINEVLYDAVCGQKKE